MTHVNEAAPWDRIVRHLESRAPVSAGALGPPATDADVRRLGEALGRPVPEELETWLRRNDGSTAKDTRTPLPGGGTALVPHPDSALLPGGEVFLDCAGIAALYHQHLRIAADIGDEEWWTPSWIPVTAVADAHYGLLLDTGRSDGSVPVLAFRETGHAVVHAPSLGHVLAGIADALERGGATALTRGYRPAVRDGRLCWE